MFNFKAVQKTLTDGSIVHDVEVNGETPWEMCSEGTALRAAFTLNNIVEAYDLCGSDRQTIKLAEAIETAIESVINPK